MRPQCVSRFIFNRGLCFGAAVAMCAHFGASASRAQDMSFDLSEASKTSKKASPKKTATPSKPASAPASMSFDTNEAASDASASGGSASDKSDVIGDLAAQEAPKTNLTLGPRLKETSEEIYAVQQIYALRSGRFELSPSFATTVNDPYMSHPAIALAANYWWTNVLAIGVSFMWYQGLSQESDLGFQVRRFSRANIPISEFQLGTYLNFTYVPIYGKFSFFRENIFQYDAYVIGGVGAMRTRPLPVVDPSIRQFDYDWRLAMNVGLGLRIFLTRWLALYGEVHDYIYLEQYENTDPSALLGDARYNPNNWLADSSTLTHNVAVHLGVSFFIPFTFDYKLPK